MDGCLAPKSTGRLTPSNIGLKMSRFLNVNQFFNDSHKIILNCYVFSVIYGDNPPIFNLKEYNKNQFKKIL